MKNTVILLSIVLIAASASAASFASDEQTLRNLERDHALATYMPNIDWFRSHVADDYVLITGAGAIKTKAEIIAQLAKGVKMDPYEPADVQIHAYGSTAVVTARIVRKSPEGRERVIADLRYMGVWIKTDEGWINISGQESPISIKREPLK
jgi:hypothetical protein